MIQRIQSFYLVLAACCMALCFMFPVAQYSSVMTSTRQVVEGELTLLPKDNPEMMNQIANIEPVITFCQRGYIHTWPLVVLAAVCIVIALATIFIYRNRVVQMRVAAAGFLLSVVYAFLIFFWAVDAYAKSMTAVLGCEDVQIRWFVGAYAPIAAVLFFFLAQRAIRKDEEKVRAADRLR
ncbi:MAG: DUF4293 domain-containing protein [Bacteroidales bacterium]|nr:DUF4293 domain-containing protein [Bacteroidales bacterium]